jgi:hypothetical protein
VHSVGVLRGRDGSRARLRNGDPVTCRHVCEQHHGPQHACTHRRGSPAETMEHGRTTESTSRWAVRCGAGLRASWRRPTDRGRAGVGRVCVTSHLRDLPPSLFAVHLEKALLSPLPSMRLLCAVALGLGWTSRSEGAQPTSDSHVQPSALAYPASHSASSCHQSRQQMRAMTFLTQHWPGCCRTRRRRRWTPP